MSATLRVLRCRNLFGKTQTRSLGFGGRSIELSGVVQPKYVWLMLTTAAIWLLCEMTPQRGFAQDVVVVRNADGTMSQREGTVARYDSQSLILRVGEREQSIDANRVESVRSPWDRLAASADSLFAERKFELAFPAYGQGNELTTPAWFRERLLAGRIKSAREMDSWPEAIETFAALLQLDAKTRFFHEIPLAWAPARPNPLIDRQVDPLLASKNPVNLLLGASHGLAGKKRNESIATLKQLSRDIDPVIAQLAKCQLWRTEVGAQGQSTLENRERKSSRCRNRFATARYGCWGTSGQASIRTGRLFCWMKIPVLFPEQFQLSADALLPSGQLLIKLNRLDKARIVLNEVVQQHEQTAEATAAKELLKKLGAPTKSK